LSQVAAWFAVIGTLVFTIVAQVLIKLAVLDGGPAAGGLAAKVRYVAAVLATPAALGGVAATFAAAACWILAMSRLPLSVAYPVLSLTFAAMLVAGHMFFGEPLPWQRVVGVGLIMAGVIVASLVETAGLGP
jgi:multidrug transporter EmrE-like cation transporter